MSDLSLFAFGTSYRDAACAFSVPVTTVHRACHSICNALIKHHPVVIRCPTEAEVEETGEGLERLSRHAAFRKAAGASMAAILEYMLQEQV